MPKYAKPPKYIKRKKPEYIKPPKYIEKKVGLLIDSDKWMAFSVLCKTYFKCNASVAIREMIDGKLIDHADQLKEFLSLKMIEKVCSHHDFLTGKWKILKGEKGAN